MTRYRRAISTTTAVIAIVVIILAVVLIALYIQNISRPSGYQTTSPPSPPAQTTPPSAEGTKLPYDASSKTVFVTLDTVTSQLDFNGTTRGRLVIYIPAGWNLQITYINKDPGGLPHSVGLIKNNTAVPKSTDPSRDGELLAWAPDSSQGKTGYLTGIDPGQSTVLKASSVAEGIYWIACGIPGHATGGMWIVLVSSSKVSEPYYIKT
ncbi:MAG: sulfocyanin-like copper-binding protein [Sulfolobales archaeon]